MYIQVIFHGCSSILIGTHINLKEQNISLHLWHVHTWLLGLLSLLCKIRNKGHISNDGNDLLRSSRTKNAENVICEIDPLKLRLHIKRGDQGLLYLCLEKRKSHPKTCCTIVFYHLCCHLRVFLVGSRKKNVMGARKL